MIARFISHTVNRRNHSNVLQWRLGLLRDRPASIKLRERAFLLRVSRKAVYLSPLRQPSSSGLPNALLIYTSLLSSFIASICCNLYDNVANFHKNVAKVGNNTYRHQQKVSVEFNKNTNTRPLTRHKIYQVKLVYTFKISHYLEMEGPWRLH